MDVLQFPNLKNVEVPAVTLRFLNWGLIPYEDALREQLSLLSDVQSGAGDTVVFCSHPPIVTTGRSTKSGDVFDWQGDVLEVQRGGRATYHGPNQLLVYPIVNLQRSRGNGEIKLFGLREFFALMESIIVNVLSSYGISACGRSGSKITSGLDGENLEATGVWVGDRKIASLGIGVKRWVTYHGLALNVDHDPLAFQGLNPCGFSSGVMTSMEEILGARVNKNLLIQNFRREFERALAEI